MGASSETDPTCVSRLAPSSERGVWRYAKADKARVIVDAADYFGCMQNAMSKAERRILLIGWDFDTRIHLAHGRKWWQRAWKRGYPRRLGGFIGWLVRHRPALEVRILKWSYGAFTLFTRGAMWIDVLRWVRHPRIKFRFDTAHPVACSHHQKIAVIDNRLAVCGGIDMTDGRWDTRDHREDNPERHTVRRSRYAPWHDATMMLQGDVAAALADLGQDRWICAGGDDFDALPDTTADLWPDKLDVAFENVEVGIARTRAAHREWDAVHEIRDLFLAHIARAQRFIYAESQYFASRAIADAILARLQEPDPPEIAIVHPANADGWLEQQAMDHIRAELVTVIEAADKDDRFSLWCPYSGETPIYVHAKIMIVDDEVLRIGSANLNNRSMGLDSECDVFIDAARPGNGHAGEGIAKLRHSLMAEHCGVEEDAIPALLEKYGSMRALFEAEASDGSRTLRRYHPPELNGIASTLAKSQLLDPEHPEEMFEPFAKGGLFREGSRLGRIRARLLRRKTRE